MMNISTAGHFFLVPAILLGMTLTSACTEPAEEVPQTADPPLADTEPVALGELQYTLYCASCHRESGRGDGPVAEALKAKPTNLRLLRSENDGTFPTERVVRYIDGREHVAAHGTREMPVWGNIWGEANGRNVPEEEVQRRINELVEYIRSIQE